MRGKSTTALVTFVLALFVAGCGDGGGDGAATCPPPGFGTDSRTTSAQGADVTFLTGVSAERTPCGDRVSFDFRGTPAGARVEYAPRERALVEDGSGRALEAEGDAFLVVRLTPAATAEANGDQIVPTYTGPRRLRPEDGRLVHEILKSGDFEAAVTWVIALDEERPFRVATSGRRLTVELA